MFDEDDEYEDVDDGLDFREPRRTRRQTAEDLRVARIRALRDELKDARGEVRALRTRIDASREARTVGSGLVGIADGAVEATTPPAHLVNAR